jgi:hypothetical protein
MPLERAVRRAPAAGPRHDSWAAPAGLEPCAGLATNCESYLLTGELGRCGLEDARRHQGREPFGEDPSRASRCGTDEAAHAQMQDDREPAPGQVNQRPAIAAVDASRASPTERTPRSVCPGGHAQMETALEPEGGFNAQTNQMRKAGSDVHEQLLGRILRERGLGLES